MLDFRFYVKNLIHKHPKPYITTIITTMDSFPEELTREHLSRELEKNQLCLAQNTRDNFTKQLFKTISTCKSDTILVFPENLWSQHKKKITMELLERFHSLTAKTISSGRTKVYTDILLEAPLKSGPPENLHSLIIKFDKN